MLFFDGWESVLRTVLSVPLIFLLVVAFVRITGVRAASRMNAYDWIVTVAMGSIVGSTIVMKDVTIIDGAAGVAMLLFAQWITSAAAKRSPRFRRIVNNSPTLVVWQGEYVERGMKLARLTPIEIDAAVRKAGIPRMEDVGAVVVEPDSSLSVVERTEKPLGQDLYHDVVAVPE